MKGAIIFSGKYGSTEQYANWIGEATELPVFDFKDTELDLSQYDYLVLGSSILYFRLTMGTWAKENKNALLEKSKILFSVSGAGPGKKLDNWIKKSFPSDLLSRLQHIGLRGRLDHSKIGWGVKLMLFVGSLFNPSASARKDERKGFDYVDKDSIEPIVELIKQHQKVLESA